MKRLCFLLPDVDSAHGVVDDLRTAGFNDSDIYVVANASTPLGDLPDAGMIEESDFYPQLARGMAGGGVIGAVGGLIAMRLAGIALGGGAVLLFGLIGAGLNGLLSAAAGAAFPNSRLSEFETAIEAGHVLVMVNVPTDDIPKTEALIRRRHPELEIEHAEPHTPVIPRG
jgi:hypothetical protein